MENEIDQIIFIGLEMNQEKMKSMKMDKSILYISGANHSPRFKPWAMENSVRKSNRFNGLKTYYHATFIQ